MNKFWIGLLLLFLTFSLNSQVDRAGTVIKISGGEITVRNENPDAPFVMGENLRLLTGDKTVLLQVTFAMQASAKCKLVSGSIGNLKIGSLVYSGGIPENPGTNKAKTTVNTNIKSMKIDDFNSFLGFKKGDLLSDVIKIVGSPSKKESGFGLEVWSGVNYTYDKIILNDAIEENCDISIYSNYYSENRFQIGKISISSFLNNGNKSKYVDTTDCGTIHYLKSKGINDSSFYLFGKKSSEISEIFGKPDKTTFSDDNKSYVYWYKTSKGHYVAFSFYSEEDLLYRIYVSFNQQLLMKISLSFYNFRNII